MADLEQHFILRVQNPELASKLRSWLRDQASIEGHISLIFEDPQKPAVGRFTVDEEEHMVVLQDLPTVVESYKTLDDANLVKVADIGQVLLVVDPHLGMQNIPTESPDGVTPPMRKARARHFKPPITLPEPLLTDYANDVLEMLAGRAPQNYEFHDVEEEYVIDPATGQGRWQPVKPSKQRAAAVAATEVATGRQQRAQRGRRKAAGSDDEHEMYYDMTDSD